VDQHLEIIVTKLKTRYKAVCPLFPECKGFGVTEEAALLKLSQSISKLIAKLSEKNLKQLFLSNSYTEVLLDSQKATKQQHRVFRMDHKPKTNPSFTLKYKAPDISPYTDEMLPAEDIRSVLAQMDEILLAQGQSVQVVDGLSSLLDRGALGPEDGIAFGFPLSLN